MQTELSKVITALDEFYAQETFLLDKDIGERAVTHRLAVYRSFSAPELTSPQAASSAA